MSRAFLRTIYVLEYSLAIIFIVLCTANKVRMITVSLEDFETYLYRKNSLEKAGCYAALYRKAEFFFMDHSFDEKNCAKFLNHIDRNISPYTYNNYLKALKKLALCMGFTFMSDYKGKRTEQPYIPILEEPEMIALLKEAYTMDFRRALVLETLLRTGMRSEELIKLEWRNYHISTIFLENTKTHKSRSIEILTDLSEKIDILRGNHPRYIFATRKGLIHRARFNQFLGRLLSKVGIDKHITVHKLRHSYATLCAAKGISHFVIQNILGHTNIQTTQTYIHSTTSMKREAAKKTSLGAYKLTSEEVITELQRYVDSLYSDEVSIETENNDQYMIIKVKKKK